MNNEIHIDVGDTITCGIQKYTVLVIKGDWLQIVPFTDNSLYMKMWKKVAKNHADPIEAIVEWYYLSRKGMDLTVTPENKRNKKAEYKQVQLAIEKDGFTFQEMLEILSFSLSNTFWSTTGMESLASLRKRTKAQYKNDHPLYTQPNMKIENIRKDYMAKMKRDNNKKKYGKK